MVHLEGMQTNGTSPANATTTTTRKVATALSVLAAIVLAATGTIGCSATSHPETPATMGAASRSASLEAVVDQPGPIAVETVVGADWAVPLAGLINLDHPTARAAGLKDRDEAIYVPFHVVRHPTKGTYLIDTGVERALFEAPDEAAIRGIVASFAHLEKMKRRTDTKTWIEQNGPVQGVFLTHLHIDHISGMRDVPAGTPVFLGPGEAHARSFENMFVAPTTNRALENKPALSVWQFQPDADGRFEGVLDVFGDGTFWAIHVPGHTPGSTAYVARTPTGPVLFTGDACHTAWGWDHGVEPGDFSGDKKRSADNLARLKQSASKHPTMEVRLGHQPHPSPALQASAR